MKLIIETVLKKKSLIDGAKKWSTRRITKAQGTRGGPWWMMVPTGDSHYTTSGG
jgi:hypothetical protein